MKMYRNTQPEFGESGPFEEESIEAAANAMRSSFETWAKEAWESQLDEFGDDDVSREDFIADHIKNNRQRYIDGLEIVE
jgi:hypothetical protein